MADAIFAVELYEGNECHTVRFMSLAGGQGHFTRFEAKEEFLELIVVQGEARHLVILLHKQIKWRDNRFAVVNR